MTRTKRKSPLHPRMGSQDEIGFSLSLVDTLKAGTSKEQDPLFLTPPLTAQGLLEIEGLR
jgi:hypothetical protein